MDTLPSRMILKVSSRAVLQMLVTYLVNNTHDQIRCRSTNCGLLIQVHIGAFRDFVCGYRLGIISCSVTELIIDKLDKLIPMTSYVHFIHISQRRSTGNTPNGFECQLVRPPLLKPIRPFTNTVNTTFSDAFSSIKIDAFRLISHWSLGQINNIPALVQIMAWRSASVS